MVILFIIIFTIFIFYLLFVKKIKINFKSFFKKGFRAKRGNWGVYCFTGKQGTGKTLNLVQFLKDNSDLPIYANISTLKDIKYTYFNGFDELLKLNDKTDCIIVYDEIFSALTRTSRMNTDILNFLSQMRKRRIIFLTTAQEWLEINITLRRYCRYRIDCNLFNLLGIFALNVKTYYDAENMKWSNEDNDYIAPIITTIVSKASLKTAQSYDTFEQIK